MEFHLYFIFMTLKKENLKIGLLGNLDLNLPVIKLGQESGPKVVLIANQHGGEIAPIFILKELVKSLTGKKLFGQVFIVPTANPLGLILGTRNEPVEGLDLNRQAPGNPEGNLASRIAAKLFNLCQGADLVIDLHAFSRQTPFCGVLIKSGNEAEAKSCQALQAIAPELVWLITPKKGEDQRFVGALDETLVQKGIPAIGLEMGPIVTISQAETKQIVSGLEKVLKLLGILQLKEVKITKKPLTLYQAKYLYSQTSGLFEPKVKPKNKVTAGQLIGIIYSLQDFSLREVLCPISGIVLTIRYQGFVRLGSKLGSIGKPMK